MVSVSNVSNTPQATVKDSTRLSQDFDQFLSLLTTQLQNQDPLSPMDSTQFTQQLVAFSGVEQQIKSNSLLSSLLASQTLNMTALGVSFIGKNVEVAGSDFVASGNAPSTISYEMPRKGDVGTISITDKNGKVVYSAPAELSAGVHSFTWNGKDKNGQPVTAGTYTVKVGAMAADKTALNVQTYVPGYVNSLETADDGSLVLDVSGKKVALSDVRKISAGTGQITASSAQATNIVSLGLNLSKTEDDAAYPVPANTTPDYSRNITVYDSKGNAQQVTVSFIKHADPGAETPTLLRPLQSAANPEGWWTVRITSASGATLSEGDINFNPDGRLNTPRDSDGKSYVSVNGINWGGGVPTQNILFNIAGITQTGANYAVTNITQDGVAGS